MVLSVSASACTVSIAGVALPRAQVTQATEALAPEVDSCEIVVPWGSIAISGASAPAESLPAIGALVEISSGSWVWRGLLTSRKRRAVGSRRSLVLTAHGPGLAMDRSYLPTFARYSLSGVAQVSGGPRFAPGTRSSTAGGPSGTYYLAGPDDWTVGDALDALVAHAPEAGLTTPTLNTSGADLSRVLPDTDGDGVSYFATWQAVLAHRMGLVWRPRQDASGWTILVRSTTASGSGLDLTVGDVTGYDVDEDASAALASLEVRGGRRHYVVSLDAYTSGSGDLDPTWSAGDESARAAGDLGSPAYRRFTITSFALPDGSSSLLADPVGTLPIAAATPLASGSSPWLVYAQKTSDSSWVSLQGRVTVSVQGSTVWIEGITPADWGTWNRIRVTMCLSPRSYLSAVHTGGAGSGRGLAIVGARHAFASAASVRISGSSLADVTGSAVTEQTPVDDAAADLWNSLSGPQWALTWTRRGIASTADAPGTRKTSVTLPVPGGSPTVVSIDCVVSSRSVRSNASGVSTTWTAVPRPFATGALSR